MLREVAVEEGKEWEGRGDCVESLIPPFFFSPLSSPLSPLRAGVSVFVSVVTAAAATDAAAAEKACWGESAGVRSAPVEEGASTMA